MEYIETIIVKYLTGTITDTENDVLQQWLSSSAEHRKLFEQICNDTTLVARYRSYAAIDEVAAKRRFLARVYPQKLHTFVRRTWRYAALLIPAVLLSLYVYMNREVEPAPEFTLTEVQPGESQAVLKLDNGFEMSLDSTSKSIQFDESVTAEMMSGTITYMPRATKSTIEYNTISVPRGGEFRLTLSDGTRVHLNAESSLRFPVVFTGGERKVQLTGEAYFEVVPNSSSQFIVEVAGTRVRQYGTVFNINAYDGRPEVVLVSGSIGVTTTTAEAEVRLAPGQKALCDDIITVSEVDVASYIGWTKGRFTFDNRRLDEIADILTRWYDTPIEIDDKSVAEMRFTGSVSRSATIHHIMNAISYAQGVEVAVVGDKIKIYK